MAGKVDESTVVDSEPVGVLADDRGLHAIVEVVRGAPPTASSAAMWQRWTLCRSWWRTNRAQIRRE
jgi:hypothetical protein